MDSTPARFQAAPNGVHPGVPMRDHFRSPARPCIERYRWGAWTRSAPGDAVPLLSSAGTRRRKARLSSLATARRAGGRPSDRAADASASTPRRVGLRGIPAMRAAIRTDPRRGFGRPRTRPPAPNAVNDSTPRPSSTDPSAPEAAAGTEASIAPTPHPLTRTGADFSALAQRDRSLPQGRPRRGATPPQPRVPDPAARKRAGVGGDPLQRTAVGFDRIAAFIAPTPIGQARLAAPPRRGGAGRRGRDGKMVRAFFQTQSPRPRWARSPTPRPSTADGRARGAPPWCARPGATTTSAREMESKVLESSPMC